jgi:hypothetical protein
MPVRRNPTWPPESETTTRRSHIQSQSIYLGILGSVGGGFGLLNVMVVLAGSGDYANPNNTALTPWLMGTNYLGMLPTLAWTVWTGIALLRASAVPAHWPAAGTS